jgi:polyisoprenoid-binding protein YceI
MLQRSLRILAGAVISFSALLGSVTNAAEAGGEYTLSKQYGSVFFKVLFQQTLMMVGRFDDYSGTLSLDPANLANAKLTASVNMTSLNMADKDVAETLVSSSSWFDTTVFSSATFTSTSVTVTGENSADFQGDLKFMGMTKPWTLHVQFFGGTDGELGGSSVGIQGTGTINRLDFGLDEYQNMAANDVAIEVNVKFNRN